MDDAEADIFGGAWSVSLSEVSSDASVEPSVGFESKTLPDELYKMLKEENVRLNLENRLLKENARLISQNEALRHAVDMNPKASESLGTTGQLPEKPRPRSTKAQVDAWRDPGGANMTLLPNAWLWPLLLPCDCPVVWPTLLAEPSEESTSAARESAPAWPSLLAELSEEPTFGAWESAVPASPQVRPCRRRRRQAQAQAREAAEDVRYDKAIDLEDLDGERTTVMLRNLPNNYSRDMVIAMLNKEGFRGLFDFFYLPIDFRTGACLGYAFVNLVAPEHVTKFWQTFNGYSNWELPTKKRCGVTWSGPHQGYLAHVERYRNSPVMHASVLDRCRPAVFKDGLEIEFPPPTKAPRAPRMRQTTHVPLRNWGQLATP